ncbi:Sister chromatid cohesion protein 2 [Dissophora globulifera]|nr:Sister chromatid cohesion protein 2 [Dissophora globulifera]
MRDLPCPSVAFPELRLIKQQDMKRNFSVDSSDFQQDYLKSLIVNASVESIPPTPPRALSDSQGPTLSQRSWLPVDLEDAIAGSLERVAGNVEADGSVLWLSTAEVKDIEHAIEELSKQGLLPNVSIDIVSALLRYLNSSLGQFDLDIFKFMESEGKSSDDPVPSNRVSRMLDRIVLSLDHVALSLTIFIGKGLLKHLYPEDLLMNALDTFKSYVEMFLLQAIESSQLFGLDRVEGPQKHRVMSLIISTCEVAEKLRQAGDSDLPDGVVVKLVYIALSLFFIDSPSETMLSLTELESLKQSGSGLLRMIFIKHPGQRTWILGEILSLLVKSPHGKRISKGYRLVDGSKIFSSSALLMHLVQACAEGSFETAVSDHIQELPRPSQIGEMQKLQECTREVLESIKSSIGAIIYYLLSRCSKGSKSSVELEYRATLDSLLADFLVVLGQPEWPSAELFLFQFSRAMMKSLDDSHSDPISRVMAVEYLGLIAAKVKAVLLSLSTQGQILCGEIGADTRMDQLVQLQETYHNVVEYLAASEVNNPASKAAKNTWLLHWFADVSCALTMDLQTGAWDNSCWNFLTAEASRSWNLFNSQEVRYSRSLLTARGTAYPSAGCLTARSQLFLSFDMILTRLLTVLESGAVSHRAKALKALSLIVAGDCSILAQQDVYTTVACRLQDQSPSVRDAATELVGKYMLQDPSIRKVYYDIVSNRISDTGVNVRKRVLRLLRDMYEKVESISMKRDISKKLLLRVSDDEPNVRELAIRCVGDVWLKPSMHDVQDWGDESREALESPSAIGSSTQKRGLSKYVTHLSEMVGDLSMLQEQALGSTIEHLLRAERGHVPFDVSGPGQEFAKSCALIVDSLINLIQTLQDEDAPKSAVASAMQTLQAFIKSEPRLISARHLSALLVYLHCSATTEDWQITVLVLRIYQDALPVVSNMSSTDSLTAEKLALSLVAKCPVVMLPEAVSVLCLLVRTWRLQSERLCKFFQTCVDLLRADTQKLKVGAVVQENKTRRLIIIVGLFCKHYPFEQAIKENPKEPHLIDLKAKMLPSVEEFVFDVVATVIEQEFSGLLQQASLRSLGSIFVSFSTLAISRRSLQIMDSIFASKHIDLRTELLQVYSDLLLKIHAVPVSDQRRGVIHNHSLIDRAEDHIGTGVGGAIMQRYLDQILQCSLLDNKQLQLAAVDVISQVASQALVHPMVCMPAIIALETSEDVSLSERALKIHQGLHQKHASLIYSKIVECVRAVFNYQVNIQKAHAYVQGFTVEPDTGAATALLNPLYSLASDKRQVRNTLLSALVKVLDVDLISQNVKVDGKYVCFVAENLAYLEYRTVEEIYLVIFHLSRIIAGPGMMVLENWTTSKSRTKKKRATEPRSVRGRPVGKSSAVNAQARRGLGTEGLSLLPVEEHTGPDSLDTEPSLPIHSLAMGSIAIEVAVVLKNYLKRIYSLSESKCQHFQPSAHATYKEKPSARFAGVDARMHWHWNVRQIDDICGQSGPKQDAIAKDDILWDQMNHFERLMEEEEVALHTEGGHVQENVLQL